MAKKKKTALRQAVDKLIDDGRVGNDSQLAGMLGLKSKGQVSTYLSGTAKPSKQFLEKFRNTFGISIEDEQDIPVTDPMREMLERVLKIEAGMEVERSILIDLLAIASNKTTTEINTRVAEALDYQISKRKGELKWQ